MSPRPVPAAVSSSDDAGRGGARPGRGFLLQEPGLPQTRRGQGGADTGCFQNRRVHPASLAGDPAGAAKLCGSGRHAQGVGSESSLSSHQRDEPWPVWGLQERWTGELEAGKGQNQPGPRPVGGSEGHPGGRAWVASTGTRLGTEGKARRPPPATTGVHTAGRHGP